MRINPNITTDYTDFHRVDKGIKKHQFHPETSGFSSGLKQFLLSRADIALLMLVYPAGFVFNLVESCGLFWWI